MQQTIVKENETLWVRLDSPEDKALDGPETSNNQIPIAFDVYSET